MKTNPKIVWVDIESKEPSGFNRIVRVGPDDFKFEHRHTDAMGGASWDHGRPDVALSAGSLPVWILRSILEALHKARKPRKRRRQ